MKNKRLRIPIRIKFILIFAVILILTIAGIAAANSILLPKLYKQQKYSALEAVMEAVDSLASDDYEDVELEKLYITKNITVYICDSYGNQVFSSTPGSEQTDWLFESFKGGDRELGPRKPTDEDGKGTAPPQPVERDGIAEEFKERPGNHKSLAQSIEEKLKNDDDGCVIWEQKDIRLGTGFIQLAAILDNGNYLYLRTPMSAVDEAADTANELLLFIGATALLLGVAVVAVAASAATRPIRQLTDIARDMANMNFDRKYEGKSSDEIGELGRSFNSLSEKLEENITKLQESNRQLEKDIELKNSVDKSRREFIANASHELKTPLALISGYAEGLKENIASSPEDRNFYCDVIIDEAGRMDKIIKQFLTVAELDSAAAESMEKHSVDLSELAEGCVRSCSLLARRKGGDISLYCPEKICVHGDEGMLAQAINNYITNAINHVDKNGVIRVSLTDKDGLARLSVYNSGSHIPCGGEELIWESFGKLDKARTRAYGGSGLGLAIVKRCIELHGGTCGFCNVEGGVEFYFEIPDSE